MKCCFHKIFLFDTHVYKFIENYDNLSKDETKSKKEKCCS